LNLNDLSPRAKKAIVMMLDGSMKISEIAIKLRIDFDTASKLLKMLEKEGLVKKTK
jgi:Mn-dependent DtxR family transcriptional regulator